MQNILKIMDDNKKHLVLVVEDEDLLLQAILRKLELNGFSVVTATGGNEALNILKSSEKLPDVIWLDYYLKDMNGLEFMNLVKNDPKWQHIPTVVVSNSASLEKVNSMLALGIKKYYLKAENRLDDIISSVKRFLDEEDLKNDGKS